MEPFEIMVSESQERMLCVVEPERLDEVLAVCEKWEVAATAIGEVTDSGRLRVLERRRASSATCRSTALVDDCPLLRPRAGEAGRADLPGAAAARSADADDPREILLALLRSANIASRRPVFEQYDCLVRSRTVRRPDEADAAVLHLRPDGATARSPSRSTAPAAASRATPTAARSRRCSSARPTSPASAPSRSA